MRRGGGPLARVRCVDLRGARGPPPAAGGTVRAMRDAPPPLLLHGRPPPADGWQRPRMPPQTPRPLRSESGLLRPRRHVMRHPTTRLVATAALALLIRPVPAVGGKWQQDAFWISFWVGPQVELSELDERFAEVSECNFTGYLGFNGAHKGSFTPNGARVAKEIELCDKHGLRCVPSLCDVECCEVPVNRS
eukprot:COSAG01_NODE_5999_length_3905_cov_9.655028_5_plen_190_part_01